MLDFPETTHQVESCFAYAPKMLLRIVRIPSTQIIWKLLNWFRLKETKLIKSRHKIKRTKRIAIVFTKY